MSDEACTARWYADPEGLTWSHRCAEIGEHEVHRCCCGATESTVQ